MKLVTMTDNLARRFGIFKALDMIKQAGFDGYDFSMISEKDPDLFGDNFATYVQSIRDYADKLGLPCLQAHSPCPLMRTKEQIMPLIGMIKRSIDISAILGCKILVVHPGSFLSAEENKEFYDEFLPYAQQKGIMVATENMFKWKDETETETVPSACGTADDFVRHMEVIKHPNFTACMDIGHAEMVNCEGAPKIIRALGDRIGCLHVHDNDKFDDWHTLPFTGKIDWEEVCKALREVNYKGHFTFEADAFLRKFPNELVYDALLLLEKTGRYLISRI